MSDDLDRPAGTQEWPFVSERPQAFHPLEISDAAENARLRTALAEAERAIARLTKRVNELRSDGADTRADLAAAREALERVLAHDPTGSGLSFGGDWLLLVQSIMGTARTALAGAEREIAVNEKESVEKDRLTANMLGARNAELAAARELLDDALLILELRFGKEATPSSLIGKIRTALQGHRRTEET